MTLEKMNCGASEVVAASHAGMETNESLHMGGTQPH